MRILIVDDHEALRKAMIDVLTRQEDIALVDGAANGAEALKMLCQRSYDVVVTDIVMPVMDGYTLMQEMRRLMPCPAPKVIVATALARDDFVMRAVELGAKFYLVKPFQPEILLGHIRRLASGEETAPVVPAIEAAPSEHSLEERLGSLFLTLGIPAHIKGYQYLRTGVKMAVENPSVVNRITKELYPGIAARFDTTASKVERAIRHAIEVAWNRGRVDTLNRALGCRVCTPEEKPTNGEFIAMLADKLRLDRTA